MKKCRYCGKDLRGSYDFCCSECEQHYRKSSEKDQHQIKYFIMGMIMGFLIMFYGVLRNHTFAAGTGIILMGMDVVILPFTTPETVSFLGYQKSKIARRILGIMLVIVGIWFEFL